MKILITGADGQLGQALIAECQQQQINLIPTNRQNLDICEISQIAEQLAIHQPDILVNTAAYTAVDKAETEKGQAYLINEVGAKNLAIACQNHGIPLIHMSTDYVFAGNASSPYTTTAPCNPQSVYGESKLAGERAIANILPAHVIIRTAWLYSEYGHNFVKTILRLAKERESISVVADQIGCPTYAPDLAKVIIKVSEKLLQPNWHKHGVYHFVGNEQLSWYQFAQTIIGVRAQHHALLKNKANENCNDNTAEKHISESAPLTTKIKPIATKDYVTLAKRPMYSVLDSNTLYQDFQLTSDLTAVATAIDFMISREEDLKLIGSKKS
jgi:dTDP-4-dehydrorhamnose reductase